MQKNQLNILKHIIAIKKIQPEKFGFSPCKHFQCLSDCKMGPGQQVNQITHWLDSSNVYGSSKSAAMNLRSFNDGLLRTITGKDGSEQLPIDPDASCVGPSTRCALAGDNR